MPVYIAAANGNLTAGATWAAVDGTSFSDSQAANTVLTTSAVASSNFTPGAITIDGIAVKVASRATSPTGTMTVDLFNATAAAQVAGSAVTINVSDLPAWSDTASSTMCGIGWTFFKFSAPILLLAATNYAVRASTSSADQVNLFSTATSNWSRMLRTTTTGVAPVAGDEMFIMGEWTAAATKTDRTVTMDSTAATDYGDADTANIATFGISKGGTLTYGTTAATNYILRISGSMQVWREGVLNIGTTGTPIPRDSSAVLEFDCAADDQFRLQVFGTLNGQGLSRTTAKNVVNCLLNTDEAAGQTTWGVDTDTGWLNGDDVAIASTTRTSSQHEQRTLNANANAADMTVSSGLTNAHSGTSPTQAEVILLTRNVVIRSVSTSNMGGLEMEQDSTIDLDWVQVKSMSGSTLLCRSWHNATNVLGSFNAQFCSFWESEGAGIELRARTGEWIGTLSSNMFYRAGLSSSPFGIRQENASQQTCTITNNIVIGSGSGSASSGGMRFVGLGASSTFSGNRFVSCNGTGLEITAQSTAAIDYAAMFNIPTITNAVIHSNAVNGIRIDCGIGGIISGGSIWRNSGAGINWVATNSTFLTDGWLVSGLTIFGNATTNINQNQAKVGKIIFRTCTIAGDTTFSTPSAFVYLGGGPWRFENCSLGVASGILNAHTTADIDLSTYTTTGFSAAHVEDLVFVDTTLGSATEITSRANAGGTFAIRKQRHEGVIGAHSTEYVLRGTVARDTVLFRTASPSEKLTPTTITSLRLESGSKRVAVPFTQSATVSVYVQKDGSYSGSQPRLRVRANPSLGLDDDQTIDTMIGGSGVWEQLSGTITPAATDDGVYEVYVDCNGTAGNVYIDDWSVSLA